MSSSWECTSGGKCEKNRNLQCRLQVKSPKGDQHQHPYWHYQNRIKIKGNEK